MYSLVIKNATVFDGTGQPGQICDVAVQGDEIVNVAKSIPTAAQVVLDAQGKFLAPGFIDIQNHSDVYWSLFENPGLDSLVSQGYTTLLVGNCGASLAPLLSQKGLLAAQKWHSLEGVNVNWQSFSEYVEELSRQRFACNIASLVGYSTLRRGLIGDQVRSLEKDEVRALKNVLEESLENGSFGLSSGLSYSHEIIISELELFELVKIVKKYQGLFSLHLRSEGGEVTEALNEALDIAKNTEANLKISHFKIKGQPNWEKFSEALGMIETAYHKGANVNFDAYPYDTVWQPLYSYLPKWAVEGGRGIMLKHFSDPVQRNKILSYLVNSNVNFAGMIVASTANRLNFSGRRISQIAKNLETTSEEAVLRLLQNGGSEVMVFEQALNYQQVSELLAHPLGLVGTDGGGFSSAAKDRLIHPRCFGTASKFLSEFAGKLKTLKWEEAIAKLTSRPAKKIGLKKRGEIKIGNFADMVIFDPRYLSDKATYENPFLLSSGVEYVFVNGKAVLSEGSMNGQKNGYILRKT